MEYPIKSDPEVLGGTPCFAGTRVPIKSFVDHIVGGYNIDFFISEFPTVLREQAEELMRLVLNECNVRPVRR